MRSTDDISILMIIVDSFVTLLFSIV